jgi:hypothetical protein
MPVLFNPFYFSIDGNGVPRAGATLSFFQTGTSSPQNTYTDSTLATPNANPVVADSNGLFPPIYLAGNFDYKAILKDASGVTIATRDPLGFTPVTATPPRDYLAGLNFTVAGGTGTFGVSAGSAADSTNASTMNLPSAFTKTTSTWALGTGAGGLDTGVIASGTWYHPYLIQRPDTGLVDVLFSLSATTPTLPANYTLFRHLGVPLKTDGSAHWIAIIHNGDNVRWVTPVADFVAQAPGVTTRVARTLTVPTGLVVFPNFLAQSAAGGSGTVSYLFTSLDEADSTINGSNGFFHLTAAASNFSVNSVELSTLHTNTSAQIGQKASGTDSSFWLNTLGWRYSRGRDA